jgi:hypothetical protein
VTTDKLLQKIEALLHDNPNISHVEVSSLIKDIKIGLDKAYVQGHCDGYNKGFRTCLDIYASK